jgi:hypothetical protein
MGVAGMRAMHEEAIAQGSIIPRTNIALSLRTPAAVIVVADIQELMQPALGSRRHPGSGELWARLAEMSAVLPFAGFLWPSFVPK